MTAVTMVKRFYILALIGLFASSASACTREKPADPTPTLPPRTVVTSSSAAITGSSATATVPSPANPGTSTVPAPAPATVPAAATPPAQPSTYTVQRGDRIYALARKFNVSVPALLAANPGIDPNLLFPGQVLNIPGTGTGTLPPPGSPSPTPSAGAEKTYTVKPGDTLFSIAVRFSTTPNALQIKNNLANPNSIYPGQILQIP